MSVGCIFDSLARSFNATLQAETGESGEAKIAHRVNDDIALDQAMTVQATEWKPASTRSHKDSRQESAEEVKLAGVVPRVPAGLEGCLE